MGSSLFFFGECLPRFKWSWTESWCAVGSADNPVLTAVRLVWGNKKEARLSLEWSWAESNRRPNS